MRRSLFAELKRRNVIRAAILYFGARGLGRPERPSRRSPPSCLLKIAGELASCLLFTIAAAATPSQLEGYWEGSLDREASVAPVAVTISRTTDGLAGQMSMPSVGMFRQPLSDITVHLPKVHFQQQNLAATFDGQIDGDQIQGRLEMIGVTGTFHLKRSREQPLPYSQEEVHFRNGPVTLAGTVTTPFVQGPHAAIVFTHGGGPDTRDLSRFLADRFARVGIASLIYDKRGTGGSSPELDWGRSSISDLAGDALSGVQFLQSRPGFDPQHIGLYGPSNGAWVVEYAASRSADVAFLIVVSGGGIPEWESELYRVEAQASAAGLSQASIRNASEFMREKFRVARTGQGWDHLDGLVEASRRADWFSLVNAPRSLSRLREAWNGQFAYDPRKDLKKLNVPFLAIFGELDTETPAKRIAAETAKTIGEGRNKNCTIRMFPRATHGILVFPDERGPWHFFRFADGYVDLMTSWVLAQVRREP
jgi:pimeloyl-ACP methyl ester carboxylesterase